MADEIENEPPQDPIHPSSRGGLFKRISAAGIIFLGLGLYLWIWPGHPVEQRFVVPKGASARTIARDLHDTHLIGPVWTFLAWVKLHGSRGALRPGVYRISPSW